MEKLRRLLEQQRRLVHSLEQEVEKAKAKLDGLEHAWAAMQEFGPDLPDPYVEVSADVQPSASAVDVLSGYATMNTSVRRRRPLSAQWQSVLAYIAHHEEVNLDSILAYIAKKWSVDRKLLRSQLTYYAKKDFLRFDAEKGSYTITDLGLSICESLNGESLATGNSEALNLTDPPA